MAQTTSGPLEAVLFQPPAGWRPIELREHTVADAVVLGMWAAPAHDPAFIPTLNLIVRPYAGTFESLLDTQVAVGQDRQSAVKQRNAPRSTVLCGTTPAIVMSEEAPRDAGDATLFDQIEIVHERKAYMLTYTRLASDRSADLDAIPALATLCARTRGKAG